MRDRFWIILVFLMFVVLIGGGLTMVACRGGTLDQGVSSSSEDR